MRIVRWIALGFGACAALVLALVETQSATLRSGIDRLRQIEREGCAHDLRRPVRGAGRIGEAWDLYRLAGAVWCHELTARLEYPVSVARGQQSHAHVPHLQADLPLPPASPAAVLVADLVRQGAEMRLAGDAGPELDFSWCGGVFGTMWWCAAHARDEGRPLDAFERFWDCFWLHADLLRAGFVTGPWNEGSAIAAQLATLTAAHPELATVARERLGRLEPAFPSLAALIARHVRENAEHVLDGELRRCRLFWWRTRVGSPEHLRREAMRPLLIVQAAWLIDEHIELLDALGDPSDVLARRIDALREAERRASKDGTGVRALRRVTRARVSIPSVWVQRWIDEHRSIHRSLDRIRAQVIRRAPRVLPQ